MPFLEFSNIADLQARSAALGAALRATQSAALRACRSAVFQRLKRDVFKAHIVNFSIKTDANNTKVKKFVIL